MTMYIDATRLTMGLESEVTRCRLLINRDHITTDEVINIFEIEYLTYEEVEK